MPDDMSVATRPGRARRRSVLAVIGVVAIGVAAVVVLVVRGGASSGGSAGATPKFVEEAQAAGIRHQYTGDFSFFVGGGVTAFDCNGDGRDELYFAGGAQPAALYRNDSEPGGALRFEQLHSPITDLTHVTGAYPIDIDSDGNVDLAVLRRSDGNSILRGLGNCSFEDANDSLGIDGGKAWTAAFSATWEGSATLPTLAFGNYLVPDTYDCAPSELVRPTVDGTGYGAPIALSPGYCTLSVLFSDWSRSGHRDLRVTNDRNYYRDGEDQLWRVVPDESPREYTAADGWQRLQIWGMGIASQDVNGDGLPEVFITSQGDNKLQTLATDAASPNYRDIALRSGVTAQRPYTGGDVLPSTAWHPEFADVNNDGFVDLFVSKGNVEAEPDYASRDPSNLLMGRPDGTFTEGAVSAGIVDFDRARGAALVDLNLDGLLDLVVVNRQADVKVWRNVGGGDADRPEPMGHWLGLRLDQPPPNVDAIGAWLEVRAGNRTTTREITIGGGHAGGQLGWIHAGLGSATTAQVRVQWPDGSTGPWLPVAADQFVTIERGADHVTPWRPPA